MEINIGSNIIRNASGVLRVYGTDQIHLEIGEHDQQLLLTMDVYDAQGNHAAKLRRNAWAFNNADRYQVTTQPSSLTLSDRTTGEVLVAAQVVDRGRVEVSQGHFYTPGGHHLIEITPSFLRVAGVTMTRNVIDGFGQAIDISSGGIGIGKV